MLMDATSHLQININKNLEVDPFGETFQLKEQADSHGQNIAFPNGVLLYLLVN